jgi:alpha,alpha-trehalase
MLGAPLLSLLLLFIPAAVTLYVNGTNIAPCDSPIYCYGEILQQIELARPFEDSKTFVDL